MTEPTFEAEARTPDETRSSFATGGGVRSGQSVVVGERDRHCCCHCPDAAPHAITVNVHGQLPDADEIVRRILAEIRTFRTYGRVPLAKDQT